MEKPTTLIGDLPGMDQLARVLTRERRAHFAQIREKRDLPPMYVKKNGKVSGTKHLKTSAEYPIRFCNKVAAIWIRAELAELQG